MPVADEYKTKNKKSDSSNKNVVGYISLMLAILGIIIAIVAIIMAIIYSNKNSGSTGPTGSTGGTGAPGTPGGPTGPIGPTGSPGTKSMYSSYTQISNGDSFEFNPGALYNITNVSNDNSVTLLHPTTPPVQGDTITVSNVGENEINLNVDISNGGYCYWNDPSQTISKIFVGPNSQKTLTATGKTCSYGMGVEIYQKGSNNTF